VSRLGLDGVIAKRADSRFNARLRSGAWVKLKMDRQQEFGGGGYRPGNLGVDALLVGYCERTQLRCAAMVRAGLAPPLPDALGALIPSVQWFGGRRAVDEIALELPFTLDNAGFWTGVALTTYLLTPGRAR
jgi:hypothetical protein